MRQHVAFEESRFSGLGGGLYLVITLSCEGLFFTIWRIFRG